MARRRRSLQDTPVEAVITGYAHDGRGIAHVDGKVVFITGALKGETVRFIYLTKCNKYSEAYVIEVLNPAPERVTPLCPHFGTCGGCNLQHLSSDSQVALKQHLLLEQFEHIGKITPETIADPLRSPVTGYRHKARLGVRYVLKKQIALVGFRELRSRFLAELQQCPILDPRIGQNIMALRALIEQLEGRDVIAQIEVALDETQVALVFRNLEPLSVTDQNTLKAFAQQHQFYIYLQPSGLHSVTPLYPENISVFETLRYQLPSEQVSIGFAPFDFTQVNPYINQQMIPQALAWLNLSADDTVLDLFCGLGNFTLPLAKHSRAVVGVEGDAGLVQRAEMNAKKQQIDNIRYYVANLADMNLQQTWMTENFDKILIDPPRAGAKEILEKLDLSNVKTIVYVSCNPSTLARDAGILVQQKGFRLVKAGIMDMFPHTAHVESMALFEK